MRLIILLIFCFAGLVNNSFATLNIRRIASNHHPSEYLTKKKKESLTESSRIRAKKHVRKSRGLKEFAPELKTNPYSFLTFNTADGDCLYTSPSQILFCFRLSGRAPPIQV